MQERNSCDEQTPRVCAPSAYPNFALLALQLVLRCPNPGDGIGCDSLHENHLGVANSRMRLKMLNGMEPSRPCCGMATGSAIKSSERCCKALSWTWTRGQPC